MKIQSTLGVLAITMLSLFTAVPAIAAATVVDVALTDHMTGKPSEDQGFAMPNANPSKAMMMVEASTPTVPAGEVTFNVTNKSQKIPHEMVVAKIVDDKTPLPLIAGTLRVDEEKAGALGEVADLDPGASGTLTLTLQPGTYILFCNVRNHYAAGMWTLLTVK